jgi:hypothetical protein
MTSVIRQNDLLLKLLKSSRPPQKQYSRFVERNEKH